MEYCLKHGAEFSITADLDVAVKEAIDEIPDKKWQLVVRGAETFLLAETIHVPGGSTSRDPVPALRLIVTRKLSGQLELFKDPIKHRAIIADLPEKLETKEYCYLTPEQAALYESTVKGMLSQAEAAGAPWTSGRVPVWKPE